MLAGQSLNKKNHSETQMNFWKKSLFYQTLFILILCLYACTPKSPGGPTIQRLRIRLASEVPSIDHTLTGDATSRDIITTLHEGLLRLDEKNKAVNGLAESWTTSRDQKKYTYKLRPHLKWSDGKNLIAQDFVDALERALKPENAAVTANFLFPIQNAAAFFEGKLKDFTKVGVKALNDKILEITLSAPFPHWNDITTFNIMMPIRKDLIARFGHKWTDATHYVSAGPYILKEWTKQGKIVAAINPLYWNQEELKGAFQEIEFRVVQEGNSAVTLFQNGAFDILQRVPFQLIPELAKTESGFKNLPTLFTVGMSLNTQHPLTKDSRLRKAIALAIDHSLLQKFLASDSTPSSTWVPEELLTFPQNKKTTYNPELAKKIWAKIKNPPSKMDYLFPSTPKAKIIAEFIQQQLKQNLRLEIELIPQEWKVFIKSQKTGEYPLFQQGWVADYPDALNFLDVFKCKSGQNYSQMCNPLYDSLLEQSLHVEGALQTQKLQKAQEILLSQEVATIPLTLENSTYLVNPRIQGFAVNGTFSYRISKLRLSSE
jgi:oligopeptide transport system substrate-binding protein